LHHDSSIIVLALLKAAKKLAHDKTLPKKSACKSKVKIHFTQLLVYYYNILEYFEELSNVMTILQNGFP